MIVPLLDGNNVAVRGFNLDDFMALLPDHYEEVSKVASMYAGHKESVFSTKALTEFILHAARTFPNLISEVISIAADEPDARNVKLGTSLQMSVLSAIAKLTVEEAGGLGNLFAQLRDVGARVLEAQAELRGKSSSQPHFNSSTGPGAST